MDLNLTITDKRNFSATSQFFSLLATCQKNNNKSQLVTGKKSNFLYFKIFNNRKTNQSSSNEGSTAQEQKQEVHQKNQKLKLIFHCFFFFNGALQLTNFNKLKIKHFYIFFKIKHCWSSVHKDTQLQPNFRPGSGKLRWRPSGAPAGFYWRVRTEPST